MHYGQTALADKQQAPLMSQLSHLLVISISLLPGIAITYPQLPRHSSLYGAATVTLAAMLSP